MRRTTLILCLLTGPLFVYSQSNFTLESGVFAHYNAYNFRENQIGLYEYGSRINYGIAISAYANVVKRMQLGIGVSYCARNYDFIFHGEQLNLREPIKQQEFAVRQHYLDLPFHLRYIVYSGSMLRFSVSGSYILGFKLNEDRDLFQYGEILSANTNYRDFLQSVRVGVDINRRVNDRITLVIQPNVELFRDNVHRAKMENPIPFGVFIGVQYQFDNSGPTE